MDSTEGDELGNFFAEIEEIETQPPPPAVDADATTTVATQEEIKPDVPVIGPSQPTTVTVVAASAAPSVVTYSKPAEMNKQATHAVYTYEDYVTAPQYSSADLTPANPYASSSAGTAAANRAVVPPPIIPRSDKKFVRKAADDVWIDDTLQEWPENDFRIFVGDLAKETTTEQLGKAFQHYPSYAMAKVIREKHTNKSKGFGFVSFLDPMDCVKAIREMNGKYLGIRPMKIKRSDWKDRDIKEVNKKENKKRKMLEGLGLN